MPTLTSALPRPRDVLDEFGIYVHVPFCTHRCWYCDFNAYAGLDHLAGAYMEALVRDLDLALSAPEEADLEPRPAVTSVFIGGGTPSLVDPQHIARTLETVRRSWSLVPGAEITIECNPESTDRRKLDAYLEAGVNRISFGVQSLDDRLLARLGRTHDAATARSALCSARAAGFEDVSADLIFGIPGETDDAWRESLEGVLECGPTHLSCYALIYEEGTPLDAWRRLGKVTPVEDDDVARRWEFADVRLAAEGFERYEISNWGRTGYRSRHNSLYWACGEYLGVGAGAHSHIATADGGRRSWTLRAPERYIRSVTEGVRPIAGGEEIDARTRASEVMILGLRSSEGVDADEFRALVGSDLADVFGPQLAQGRDRGLLAWEGERVRTLRPLLGNEAAVLFAC
jgi:oxygen-independent coproporphyrinogen-3 oxidase